MFRRLALSATVLLATLAVVGCMHPTGYTDLRAVITPTGGGEQVRQEMPVEPIRLVRDITTTNAVLEVCVESLEVVTGPVRREVYGRQTYAYYTWYTPLVKPVLSVLIIPPLWLSMHDPHAHGAGNWTRVDYFRDVIAWYNWFSAVPTGPRRIASAEVKLRTEETEATLRQTRRPIAGCAVSLHLDGVPVATATTDANGAARFDLASRLTADLARSDHTLRLDSRGAEGESFELSLPLKARTVQQWLNRPKAE